MTLPVAASLAWPFHRPAPMPKGPVPWWATWGRSGDIARYCPVSGAWLPRPGAFCFWLGREG
jgi:hypothetical protein